MKKVLNIVCKVLAWTLVAVSFFVMIIMMIISTIPAKVFNSTERSLFGYKFFIAQTDSMSKPEEVNENVTTKTFFNAGDIVIVKGVAIEKCSELKPDEVITFISRNSASFGETVTHAIRKKAVDSDGTAGFVTYGANTGADDEAIVGYGDVVGKYVGRIPMLGKLILSKKTLNGFITCMFVPILFVYCSKAFTTFIYLLFAFLPKHSKPKETIKE